MSGSLVEFAYLLLSRFNRGRFTRRAASTMPDADKEGSRQFKPEDAGKIFVFWAFMEWNLGYPLINGLRGLVGLPVIGKPPPGHTDNDGIKSKYKWEHNEN